MKRLATSIVCILTLFILVLPSVLAQDIGTSTGALAVDDRNTDIASVLTTGADVAPSLRGGRGNDHQVQSFPMVFANGFWQGSNVGAQAEASENPSASCASGDGNNSIWFWFLPTSNGTIILDTSESNFDTVLTLLTTNGLNEVACDDDGGEGLGSFIEASVSGGVPYFVRLTGFAGAEGDYRLDYEGPITGPPNDANWLRMIPEEYDFYRDRNTGADINFVNEPSASCTSDGNNSVWRLFTAPFDATVTIDLSGSDFDTVLMITDGYEGTELACNDDGGEGTTSRIENFPVTAGTSYYVRITGWQGAEGTIRSIVNYNPLVSNEESSVPEATTLEAAYPNPFASRTTLPYFLSEAQQDIRIAAYDVLGREVAVLAEGAKPAGEHQATFDAASLPSGIYVIRLTAGKTTITRRVTVVR